MRIAVVGIGLALVTAACAAPKDAAKVADSVAAAPAAAGPGAVVTVLYKWPADPAAFERYYPTHLTIVTEAQADIGFTRVELTKFTASLDGGKPAFYRQAELYFPSMEAAQAGMKSAGFARVGDDFKNFVAADGLVGMVAEDMGDASTGACPVLGTVLYHTPADAAAFEQYYPTHLEILGRGQPEIAFTRADLTRFVSSLDGGTPAFYRQAELCFPTVEARTAGMGTAAFKAVGDDFVNFVAKDGLVGMVGEQQ